MTWLKHMRLWSQNIHKNRWKLMLGVSSLPWNNIHQKYFITTTTSHTGIKSLSLTSIKQSSSSCISKICFTSSFFSLHLQYVEPDDGIEEQSDYNHWQPGTELYWPTAHVSRCQIFSHSLTELCNISPILYQIPWYSSTYWPCDASHCDHFTEFGTNISEHCHCSMHAMLVWLDDCC